MGLLRRLKDPVDGVAQVVSASSYRGDGFWQNCHMTLVVQAEGLAPFSADWNGLVRSKRWPFPGMTLPVRVDRANPGRYKVLWGEVESVRDSARRTADAVAGALGGDAAETASLPDDLPPEAAAIVGKITEMFPDATIVTSQDGGTIVTGGHSAEDERLGQIERLAKLRDAGDLTAEEYETEKARILRGRT